MKIKSLKLKDFMLFDNFDMEWSKNINIICGSNSTGKTILIKTLYALTTSYRQSDSKEDTKDEIERRFVNKITGVYRPEDMRIGRMVRRHKEASAANGKMCFDDDRNVRFAFSNRYSTTMGLVIADGVTRAAPEQTTIYFPPKEIISAAENFRAVYEDYHIAIEETYNDLVRLLQRPFKRGRNTAELNEILNALGDIMQGEIVSHENKFYLKVPGQGEFEMGLVSEGYRKLSTIVVLLLNGSLNADTILFWDEPETNMNPKMIEPLVKTFILLAKLGVQIFITTHDYFLMQYFNMYTAYPETNPDGIDIRFISLHRENGLIIAEQASEISELSHNDIMEEFDAIFSKEQRIMYAKVRK